VASLAGGLPSTTLAALQGRPVVAYGLDTTRRVGVLVPPFRRGFARGVLAHAVISVVAGEVLAATLPRPRSIAWGAAAGLVMGIVNVGVIGRRIPAIAELPLAPQLADNIAFGMIFAAIVDHKK